MSRRILTFAETQAIWDRFQRLADEADAPLYALVDAARSPRILPLVEEHPLARRCLYDPPLPRRLARAAPYLAALGPHATLPLNLIAHGFGDGWCLFLTSDAPPDHLRAHLRQFLRVRDHRGRRFLFRYYDPRVLRAFLPACTADELRAFFGPIGHFLVESRAGDQILDFSRGDGGVRCRSVAVEARC